MGNNYGAVQDVKDVTGSGDKYLTGDAPAPSVRSNNDNDVHISNAEPLAHDDGAGVGMALGLFVPIILVMVMVLWIFYAYRNPHTKSGQFLIQVSLSNFSFNFLFILILCVDIYMQLNSFKVSHSVSNIRCSTTIPSVFFFFNFSFHLKFYTCKMNM